MDSKNLQYQRAVTPAIDNNIAQSGLIKGKILTYNNMNLIRGKMGSNNTVIPSNTAISHSRSNVNSPRSSFSHNDMSILGKSNTTQSPNKALSSSLKSSGNRSSLELNSLIIGELAASNMMMLSNTVTTRNDLIPVSEETPLDGIIFARYRNISDSLVVYRTNEERARNPERLNLDKRQLEICPLLEQEQRLRLLNYQNNNIKVIQNLENLPNLIFLDLYNNKITSLNGSLTLVKGLRVLMAGKNKISSISNLSPLRKLDVLDLHSNDISIIEGLDGLSDLRVLNLAGNKIGVVNNSLSSLASLTELNLRRNKIEFVTGLNKLPALQRVFLSHNLINSTDDIKCLFDATYLIELCLDGNPLSERDPIHYRQQIVNGIRGLRHLDLKKVTEEERLVTSFTSDNIKEGHDCSTSEGESSIINENLEYSINRISTTTANTTNVVNNSSTSNNSQICHTNVTTTAATQRLSINNNSLDTNNSSTTTSIADSYIRRDSRTGLQKYVKTSTTNIENNLIADSISNNMIRNDINITTTSEEKVANIHTLQTLTSLAKSGKISNTNSLFDVEIIGPEEKAIVIVGDNWEWSSSKRLLGNVVEASICYTKRQTILSKFTSNQIQQHLPALKSIRFYSNDFISLNNLEFISQLCGNQIENLTVKNSPICNSISPDLLRSYFIATMPSIKTFNDIEITSKDHQDALHMYIPLIKTHQMLSENSSKSVSSSINHRYNNNSISGISQSERSNISYKSFQKCLMNNNIQHRDVTSLSTLVHDAALLTLATTTTSPSITTHHRSYFPDISSEDNSKSTNTTSVTALVKDSNITATSTSTFILQQYQRSANFNQFMTSFDSVIYKLTEETLREMQLSNNT